MDRTYTYKMHTDRHMYLVSLLEVWKELWPRPRLHWCSLIDFCLKHTSRDVITEFLWNLLWEGGGVSYRRPVHKRSPAPEAHREEAEGVVPPRPVSACARTASTDTPELVQTPEREKNSQSGLPQWERSIICETRALPAWCSAVRAEGCPDILSSVQ